MDDKETLNECIINKEAVFGDDVTVTKTIAVEETQRPTKTTTTTKTGKPTLSEKEVFDDSFDEGVENTIEEKSSKISSKKKIGSKPTKINKNKFVDEDHGLSEEEEGDGNELVGCPENHCHQVIIPTTPIYTVTKGLLHI
jgi:hypothetical protein